LSWTMLLLAGFFEIGFTTAMRLSNGFSKLWPSLLFVAFAALSFACLQRATREIPLGTAYAVWTGVGAAGTLLVGIVAFSEPVNLSRMILLALLLGSIIGLKVFAPH
jgi:quaternary ammonium compound-resistance protein SugE